MFPSGDIDRYNFLKQHVPPPIDDLMKQIYQNVEQTRIEILEVERFISLSLLTRTARYPAKFMPPLKDFIEMLEHQIPLTAEEVTPSFVQHTSLLVSHVYCNIEQLVNGVAAMKFSDEFPFIVSSMLPSIFGFFTSAEYMIYASKFYTTFVRTQRQKVSLTVIQPYFCSVLTYRYVESVMSGLLIKMGAESELENEQKVNDFINKYSNLLTNLIVESMPLLPTSFFEIFKIVLNNKWKKPNMLKLFFNNFINPQFMMFIYASPYARRKNFLYSVLENIRNNDKYFTQILNSWFLSLPNLEIVSIYTPYSQVFMTLFLSIADVMMIAHCLQKVGNLPSALDDVDYNHFKHKVRFSPLFVRVYPKELKTPPFEADRLLIPYFEPKKCNPKYDHIYRSMRSVIPKTTTVYDKIIERHESNLEFVDYSLQQGLRELRHLTESLEKYLVAKYQQVLLHELKEIVRSREFFIKIPFATKEITSTKDKIRFIDIAKKFPAPHVKRILFLYFLSYKLENFMTTFKTEISTLSQSWQELSTHRKSSLELSNVNVLQRSAQEIFWKTVDVIHGLTSVYVSRSYELLMNILYMIKTAGRDQWPKLMRSAMIFSRSGYIPIVYIMFNELAIKNFLFKEMLTEADYSIWIDFEGFVLQYANEPQNPTLGMLLDLRTKLSDMQFVAVNGAKKKKKKSALMLAIQKQKKK